MDRFCNLSLDLLFDFLHENIGKGYSHLSARGGSVCLQAVPFVELKKVFLKNPFSSKHFGMTDVSHIVESHVLLLGLMLDFKHAKYHK